MQVERWVMAPGETNNLPLTVYSHAETQTEALTLGLQLPAGLQTAAGQSGLVAWQTPPLPNGERFRQVVSLPWMRLPCWAKARRCAFWPA
jgi:hypothetical protein